MKLAVCGGTPVRQKPFPNWPQWDKTEERNLLEVLHSGKWFRYQGTKVAEFEEAFARFCGVKHALAVTSGTKALEACVNCLELPPDSEVIVPAYTFVSTATCVINNHLTVVFADVDPATLNVTVDALEAVRTERTRAVIVVHFAGLPCEMDEITAWADEHGIAVIEDACHAHGGKWDGRYLGSIGRLGAFSFQASKNMTAGEGGVILTDSDELIGRLWARSSYGQRKGQAWYAHYVVSSNLRMTEWAGAILLAQLTRLERQTRTRLENAWLLDEALKEIPGVAAVGLSDPRAAERAYHLYPLRYLRTMPGVNREQIAQALVAEGIPATVGYPRPLYAQPLFSAVKPAEHQGDGFADLRLSGAEQACEEVIWLPQNTLLGDREDTMDIIRAVEKVMMALEELRS